MQSDFAQQDAELSVSLSVLVDSRHGENVRIKAVQQLAQYKSPPSATIFVGYCQILMWIRN